MGNFYNVIMERKIFPRSLQIEDLKTLWRVLIFIGIFMEINPIFPLPGEALSYTTLPQLAASYSTSQLAAAPLSMAPLVASKQIEGEKL